MTHDSQKNPSGAQSEAGSGADGELPGGPARKRGARRQVRPSVSSHNLSFDGSGRRRRRRGGSGGGRRRASGERVVDGGRGRVPAPGAGHRGAEPDGDPVDGLPGTARTLTGGDGRGTGRRGARVRVRVLCDGKPDGGCVSSGGNWPWVRLSRTGGRREGGPRSPRASFDVASAQEDIDGFMGDHRVPIESLLQALQIMHRCVAGGERRSNEPARVAAAARRAGLAVGIRSPTSEASPASPAVCVSVSRAASTSSWRRTWWRVARGCS